MTQYEFETRAGISVSAEEYESIEAVYMASDLCKDDFCRLWSKMNKTRISEYKRTQEERRRAEDYGDDYECARNAAEWWQDEKGIMDCLEFGSPAEMREYLGKIEEVYDEIESLGDNEQLLICRDGSYSHEVIPVKTLRYHIDVWSHEIAVV